jgi:hypothetical protein
MPPGKKSSSPTGASSSSLDALAGMLGSSSSVSPDGCNAALLWMAMVALLNSGASLQLSMNKARTSFLVTVYDGEFPRKDYVDSAARLNFHLAAVVKAYMRRELPEGWAEVVDQHFPWRGEGG